jgi:hypothetical protein
MMDLFVIVLFFAMLLSPCFVALATGIPTGAELGVRDPSEPGFAESEQFYIPG